MRRFTAGEEELEYWRRAANMTDQPWWREGGFARLVALRDLACKSRRFGVVSRPAGAVGRRCPREATSPAARIVRQRPGNVPEAPAKSRSAAAQRYGGWVRVKLDRHTAGAIIEPDVPACVGAQAAWTNLIGAARARR